ncbi:MAG: hypothetical protein HY300_08905 [Verrucomicrobia bacterium]|nr:hypothetical protein [Verrucomicrobiota bacterium]
MSEVFIETGLSNADFLAKHARAGRIVLSGGETLIDRAIRRAQRHLNDEKRWAKWSHAFVLQGVRADGHLWVIESDLQVLRKHVALGVQENRITKYHNEEYFAWLAVLDFGLTEEQIATVIREGLELVANKARYSLRELLGAAIAMRRPELREGKNVLARDHSFYCSALVSYLYTKAGVDPLPGVDDKNTTPEDLANSPSLRAMWVLDRQAVPNKLGKLTDRVRERLKERAKKKAAAKTTGQDAAR